MNRREFLRLALAVFGVTVIGPPEILRDEQNAWQGDAWVFDARGRKYYCSDIRVSRPVWVRA